MKRSQMLSLWAVALLGAMATSGCKKEAATTPAEPATTSAAATEDPEGTTETEGAEEIDVFAALSESDRTAAMAQKICPVGDSELGSMGTPVKVTIEGRDVFLCCEHCREQLEADPAKYFAKLDAATTSGEEATATQ